MLSLDQKNFPESPSKKQNTKDLMISIDGLSNNSVWTAKKQRAQLEKHLDILKNRLALLMNEEIRANKLVSETKRKTISMVKLKQMNYYDQVARSKIRNNQDGNLEKQRLSIDIRNHQKEVLQNLRTDLISLKAQESSKIKKTQEENLKKLLDIKNQHIREKKEQVSLVKVAQSTSRKKIEYYWEQKKKYHSELRAQETLENEKIKENLEKNLNSLEKLELNLLNRLEKTQDVQTRLYDKFEEAFLLSPSEFSEKQKLKKSQINNKANVRKIEGDLEILNENKKN